jgi:hypothetical protein
MWSPHRVSAISRGRSFAEPPSRVIRKVASTIMSKLGSLCVSMRAIVDDDYWPFVHGSIAQPFKASLEKFEDHLETAKKCVESGGAVKLPYMDVQAWHTWRLSAVCFRTARSSARPAVTRPDLGFESFCEKAMCF